MTKLNSNSEKDANRFELWKRKFVKLFIVLFAIVLVVDTGPAQFSPIPLARQWLSPVLNRLGLWQGEWPLFAPEPKLNNAWLSADIHGPDSEFRSWNSTFWFEESSWAKFYRFRHMNYEVQMPFSSPEAIEDFADCVARQVIGEGVAPIPDSELAAQDPGSMWTLELSRNSMNLTLPGDGSLPSRDETAWVLNSRTLVTRYYKQ